MAHFANHPRRTGNRVADEENKKARVAPGFFIVRRKAADPLSAVQRRGLRSGLRSGA